MKFSGDTCMDILIHLVEFHVCTPKRFRCTHMLPCGNVGNKNRQTSPLLSDLFCLSSVSTTHRTARLTRSQVSNGLVLPNVSRRFGLHSLSYLAAVKWNSAPPDIRNATSLHDLRIQLCTWLGHPVRRPIGL